MAAMETSKLNVLKENIRMIVISILYLRKVYY